MSNTTCQVPAGLGIALDCPSRPRIRAETVSHHRNTGPSPPTDCKMTRTSHLSNRRSTLSSGTLQSAVSDALGSRSHRGTARLTVDDIADALEVIGLETSVSRNDSRCTDDGLDNGTPAAERHSEGMFVRSDTLLSFGVSQARNAAELRTLMGNAHARLKPGATVRSAPKQNSRSPQAGEGRPDAVSLEQAKPRARVEVDIVLESNAFVQGGHLKGHLKLRVRKRTKKEAPVSIAEGKVRIVGFECIPGEDDRHTFYQCASPLSAITDNLDSLYMSPADEEGFAQVMEGVHVLPFAMRLPSDGAFGTAKGVLNVHSGVTVRYIAMISIKVKDSKSGKRSIAHFFRNCEIWPRLNPSVVLASAPRPLQAATSKGLSVLNSSSKVKLTALLHRLTWIAGQRCYVNVSVVNETKKTVKTLTLTLVRTTTVFRPKPVLDAGNARSVDPDACQTTTIHKVVTETVLEMAQRGTKGHASAKGWWTGVGPGQELSFSHFILLPPEALSVARGRLLEVEHSIRVTLSAGSLTSDVHVTLPIRIINFLSVDPTPSGLSHSPSGAHVRPLQRRRSIDGEIDSSSQTSTAWSNCPEGSRPGNSLYDHLDLHRGNPDLIQCQSQLQKARRATHAGHTNNQSSTLHVMNPDRLSSSVSHPLPSHEEDDISVYSSDVSSCPSSADELASSSSEAESRGLGNLDVDDPDSDEEVDSVIGSTLIDEDEDAEDVSRFVAGPEYGSCASSVSVPHPVGPRPESHLERGRKRGRRAIHQDGQEALSSFAQRVNDKLASVAASTTPPVSLPLSSPSSPLQNGSSPSPQSFELGVEISDAPVCTADAHTAIDGDATPRLAQTLPQIVVRPLRPFRHPGRCTGSRPSPGIPRPVPSAVPGISSSIISAHPSATSNLSDDSEGEPRCRASNMSTVGRASRELPRPPASIPPLTINTGPVPVPVPATYSVLVGSAFCGGIASTTASACPSDAQPSSSVPIPGSRSPDDVLSECIACPTTRPSDVSTGLSPPGLPSPSGSDQHHRRHQHYRGPRSPRGMIFRGRLPRVLPQVGTSERRSGKPHPSPRAIRPASVHAYSAAVLPRPMVGMQRASTSAGESASASAVQGRVAQFEERVKCAQGAGSAYV